MPMLRSSRCGAGGWGFRSQGFTLLITHKVGSANWGREGLLFLESQRDSAPQSRVARTALPWETIAFTFQAQRAMAVNLAGNPLSHHDLRIARRENSS